MLHGSIKFLNVQYTQNKFNIVSIFTYKFDKMI